MKYIIILVLIIAVSVIGYYAGQNFYKEKISQTKEVEKPLISPLIEEKKHSTFSENDQPSIIVPQLQKEEKKETNNKKENYNNNKNNTTSATTVTTTETTVKQQEKMPSKHNTNGLSENTVHNGQQKKQSSTPESGVSNSESEILTSEVEVKNNEENVSGLYYIQVGSFSSIDNAQAIKSQLESLGLVPKVEQVIVGQSSIYRVIIGPYQTEQDAIQESNRLKKMGFDNVVKTY